jgi:hypothetical protein
MAGRVGWSKARGPCLADIHDVVGEPRAAPSELGSSLAGLVALPALSAAFRDALRLGLRLEPRFHSCAAVGLAVERKTQFADSPLLPTRRTTSVRRQI